MGLSARLRLAWALLAVLLGVAAFDLASWWHAHRLELRIARVDEVEPRDDDPPRLRHARAARLAERGEFDAALNLYRSLHGDPALAQGARFNGANLLLRQALRLRESANPGQAVTLIELAKQGYRDTLRNDPQHWDARYNLERAQRLLPEPEEIDPPIAEPRNDAERAVTTMRGVAPGAP